MFQPLLFQEETLSETNIPSEVQECSLGTSRRVGRRAAIVPVSGTHFEVRGDGLFQFGSNWEKKRLESHIFLNQSYVVRKSEINTWLFNDYCIPQVDRPADMI